MADIKTPLPGWLVEYSLRNPITREALIRHASAHRAILEASTQGQDVELSRLVVAADGYTAELQAVIRETIPVLERAGRMVLAVKLRKLVDG